MSRPITGALYEHYKGHQYRVIGIANHSETLEELVIYKEVDTEKMWARPLEMFMGSVTIEGNVAPRFRLL